MAPAYKKDTLEDLPLYRNFDNRATSLLTQFTKDVISEEEFIDGLMSHLELKCGEEKYQRQAKNLILALMAVLNGEDNSDYSAFQPLDGDEQAAYDPDAKSPDGFKGPLIEAQENNDESIFASFDPKEVIGAVYGVKRNKDFSQGRTALDSSVLNDTVFCYNSYDRVKKVSDKNFAKKLTKCRQLEEEEQKAIRRTMVPNEEMEDNWADAEDELWNRDLTGHFTQQALRGLSEIPDEFTNDEDLTKAKKNPIFMQAMDRCLTHPSMSNVQKTTTFIKKTRTSSCNQFPKLSKAELEKLLKGKSNVSTNEKFEKLQEATMLAFAKDVNMTQPQSKRQQRATLKRKRTAEH